MKENYLARSWFSANWKHRTFWFRWYIKLAFKFLAGKLIMMDAGIVKSKGDYKYYAPYISTSPATKDEKILRRLIEY
jgi:hypothetical protein